MVFVTSSTTLADLCGTQDDIIVPDPLRDRTVADLIGTLEEVEIPDPQEMKYYEELLEAQEHEYVQERSW